MPAEDEPHEPSVAPDPCKPPINDLIGNHDFVESEFAAGAGRCDRCGGGPEAEIHQKKPAPLEGIATGLARIARALERIADRLEPPPESGGNE